MSVLSISSAMASAERFLSSKEDSEVEPVCFPLPKSMEPTRTFRPYVPYNSYVNDGLPNENARLRCNYRSSRTSYLCERGKNFIEALWTKEGKRLALVIAVVPPTFFSSDHSDMRFSRFGWDQLVTTSRVQRPLLLAPMLISLLAVSL